MGDNESPGVLITVKDIYDEMKGLIAEVRIMTAELRESRKTDDDHEQRIRKLEAWKYGLPAALLISIGSVLMKFFPGKA